MFHRLSLSALLAATALASGTAHAADAPADQQDQSNNIVVTARAGNSAQKKVEASYAISTISEQELNMKAPIGVGEALKSVPGFWVESSSGESSGNIRVRGIPTDGYSSLAILEDGITIQHDAGLGWLNADQSLRVDQTVQSIEVVRGGPSSIFYANAPGAVVNFITRRGGDHLEGEIRYEGSDYNSQRVDAWIGGPIGNSDWRYLVGGYYRLSDGQRHSGYRQDQGGQIRGTISREFDRGSIMFGIKRIDERTGNAMDTPFVNDKNGNPVGVPGFNALTDTIAGPETRRFDFLTPNGTYKFDDAVGNTIRLTQLTGEFKYDLGDRFTVQDNIRYRDSYTKRNSITPYQVASASDLLEGLYGKNSANGKKANLQPGQSLGFVYTNDPSKPFNLTNQNGNGLALVDLARSFTVPESELVNDFRVLKTADFLGKHDLAFGAYFAHVHETYQTHSAAVLTDVKDNASLLDAYVFQDGKPIRALSDNGIANEGTEYNNAEGSSNSVALYATDEWKITDKLRIDGGFRWEHIHADGQVEKKTTADLGQSATLADDSALVGTGVFVPFSENASHSAWTLGANYQFHPKLGLFARYTSTYRLPGASDFMDEDPSDPTSKPVTQTMDFFEGGLKYSHRTFEAYLTGFRSIYKSWEIDDFKPNAANQLELHKTYGNTETWGIELEGTWRPVKWFDLHANWTWQDARFSKFNFTDENNAKFDYSGNRLIRVPANAVRITPAFNLVNDRLRIEADIAYYGKRYADVANQINLPSYTTLDVNARFNVTPRLSVNLFINNLTNEIGLTEGNPRQGTIQNAEVGDAVYIARSIFGRSFRGSVAYRF